jgi:hypothetical protein
MSGTRDSAAVSFKLAHLLIKFPPGRLRGSKNYAYPIENRTKEKVRLFVTDLQNSAKRVLTSGGQSRKHAFLLTFLRFLRVSGGYFEGLDSSNTLH